MGCISLGGYVILYFEETNSGLIEVDFVTKNMVILDDKLRDSFVTGLCERCLINWRSPIDTVPKYERVSLGKRNFEWNDNYWVML